MFIQLPPAPVPSEDRQHYSYRVLQPSQNTENSVVTTDQPDLMAKTLRRLLSDLIGLWKLHRVYRKEQAEAKKEGRQGVVQAEDYDGYVPLFRRDR